MHWLLILALLSSTTQLQEGQSGTALNRAAETALRQQLGSARQLSVDVARSRTGGTFDRFNVTLDGFSLDNLARLADTPSTGAVQPGQANTPPDSRSSRPRFRLPDLRQRGTAGARNLDVGDIFDSGILGDFGDLEDFGGAIGGIFGRGAIRDGRINNINIRATNFDFQGVRYDGFTANLGQLTFDWQKALRGEFDVKSLNPGSLLLNLRGDQAQRLIAPRLPSVRDLRVDFQNGLVQVGGRTDYYGVKIPFDVGARLSVATNRVMAQDFRVKISRLRLPSFVVDELTRGVNPLYDFDPQQRWPLVVNLQSGESRNNTLGMRGGIEWVGFNRQGR